MIQAKNAVEHFSTGFLKFQLQNGPVITVRSLQVALTYEGWLEGLPNTRFNNQEVACISERVRWRRLPKVPIHVCKVPRHSITGQFATGVGAGEFEVCSWDVRSAEFLPRLEVFAYCESTFDSREPGSCRGLIIVWHQDEFEPLPVPRVRDEIEQLDWHQLAEVLGPD